MKNDPPILSEAGFSEGRCERYTAGSEIPRQSLTANRQ